MCVKAGDLGKLKNYSAQFAVVLDRGFRPENMEESKDEPTARLYNQLDMEIWRPAYLKGDSAFTAAEVADSRKTSSIRTSIETVIGHLKKFALLAAVWKGRSAQALYETMLIAAALVNRNFKRVRSNRVPGALPVDPIQSESLHIG